MTADIFVDTNVLIYAHDVDAGKKHDTARRLLTDFWQSRPWPWLSVQVLQEMLVTLQRQGMNPVEARNTVEDYSRWRTIENTVSLLKSGMDEMNRWQLSLWDGLILAAARRAGVATVLSEDLSDEQDYGGIRIVNPFR